MKMEIALSWVSLYTLRMVVVVQRVSRAELFLVDKEGLETLHGAIGPGLVALVGFEKQDPEVDVLVDAFLRKIPTLRVFEDSEGRMNLSLRDLGYGLMVVPNFTLAGSVQKGRRPSFDGALAPEHARIYFERLVNVLNEALGSSVSLAFGVFGAHMRIHLVNDGPVTLIWRYPSR